VAHQQRTTCVSHHGAYSEVEQLGPSAVDRTASVSLKRQTTVARLESGFSVDLQPPKTGDLTQDNIFDSCGSDALDRVQWRPAEIAHAAA
jgi:hypothetical protein